jgi:hypothetical protein
MNRGGLLIVAAAVIASACCEVRKNSSPLIGEWRSGIISTEWGEGETIIVFASDTLTVSFEPKTGETLRTSASYVVREGQIVSEALNSGSPMPYTLSGNVLVLKDATSGETRLLKK